MSGEITPDVALKFERELSRLTRELGRKAVEFCYNQAEPAEPVTEIRPETRGAAAARGGVDDGERARQARPPPIARRKSVMEAKRIMGFPRFSSPMVVCEPP